jgi:transposase-like protein
VRERIQGFIQALLEEEVTSVLGRRRSERRRGVDARPGYRNGYGKPRRLSLTSGTITVRRPRLRGLAERFESRLLPLFARRTREVGALLPTLSLHGLAQGDFELALRGLLWDGAPLSPSSLQRLRAQWEIEDEAWRSRELSDRELVYLWADGRSVKAGLEREKAALLIVIGAMRDGPRRCWPWRAGCGSRRNRGRPSCARSGRGASEAPG